MKLFYCVFLFLFVTFNAHSQNCEKLDKASFFNSIKFGSKTPEGFDRFRTGYDGLSQADKKKYSDAFRFMHLPFSFLQLGTNDQKQIYSVELYFFFENEPGKDSINYAPPTFFTKAYNKLVSWYGKPAHIREPGSQDSLFIKELGMSKQASWFCNDISLDLEVRYGASNKDLNIMRISIINGRYADPPGSMQEMNDNSRKNDDE